MTRSRSGSAMALSGIAAAQTAPPSAAIVSQRLSSVLMSFPAAASSGVQWEVLAKKYEQRYASQLDIASLGHSSPLVAAMALLFDDLRIVDKDDLDNPIVALEDAVVLTAQPGSLATWPSLYRTLCEVVLTHGTACAEEDVRDERRRLMEERRLIHEDGARTLLLSQLRPLLERHWHSNFDESALGYLNEDGTFVKMKKMKHLIHAILAWRVQRLAWHECQGSSPTEVDEALQLELEVSASSKHSDLVLRCSAGAKAQLPRSPQSPVATDLDSADSTSASGFSEETASSSETTSLMTEVARLRMENEALRKQNFCLQQTSVPVMVHTPIAQPMPPLQADIFDDPFEPPPEAFRKMHMTPSMSTLADPMDSSSEVSFDDSCPDSNDYWRCDTSACSIRSGTMSPCQTRTPQGQSVLVPMWFPFSSSGPLIPSAGLVHQAGRHFFDAAAVIPQGIVGSARAQFERLTA